MNDRIMAEQIVREIEDALVGVVEDVLQREELDLGEAEERIRRRMQEVGASMLDTSLAVRGSGKEGARLSCPCGAEAGFEGYRDKGVQTLVGWITVRRAYYWCRRCGQSQMPLDTALGLQRDSHSPGVRALASRFGALLPFAQAEASLDAAALVQVSASSLRTLSEAAGAHREQELDQQVQSAWETGHLPAAAPGPDRLCIAMDGVYVLGTDGHGKEAKVGVLRREQERATGWQREPNQYVASFADATAFGQRLALAAYQCGSSRATEVVVLGDGAEWIWQLAAEHFPYATCIVDWYHASERIWEMGRAFYGEDTPQTRAWVQRQLHRLADGQVHALIRAWRRRDCTGHAATVRDAQVTYFTNQAARMAYDQYRARGFDIGSGMVESAVKHVIGARQKGPGMRWSVPGAQAIANLRVLLFNQEWDQYWHDRRYAA